MTGIPATDGTADSPASGESAPVIRVIAGNPTPTELAAVTAVLTALASEDNGQRMPVEPVVRSAWSASQRQLRREIVPGPGVWHRPNL